MVIDARSKTSHTIRIVLTRLMREISGLITADYEDCDRQEDKIGEQPTETRSMRNSVGRGHCCLARVARCGGGHARRAHIPGCSAGHAMQERGIYRWLSGMCYGV